jgi:heme/copper-type cytochrome/quinol oxidase subunit 3
VLLRSGVSVTWAHHGLIGCADWVLPWFVTIFLGVYFTFLQGMEYYISSFSIRDSVFGAGFYIATGFHGLHVIVGTLFLTFSVARVLRLAFTSNCCLGLEISIWYWHFVDVVWLFLFMFIYWWGY